MFHMTAKSRNEKTGPIAVSTTSATTCPDACPLKAGGCYAKGGKVAMHWRAVTAGERGGDLASFLKAIRAIKPGALWRHNQAGDLPGEGDMIDVDQLGAIVDANKGRRGFTYTHKPIDVASNRAAIAQANAEGFTVNLSGNTLEHADQLMAERIGPVVVVLDAEEGKRHDVTTPAGHKVVTCPATYREDVTCASCGLCAVRDRKVIVGFPAHGAQKNKAAIVARG